MSAYLFSHFIGEEPQGEQIYFSVSKDGLHWNDLNVGKPILCSEIGTKGVRDPFLVRHPETGKVYLIATDLRISAGNGWETAQYGGSRDLIIWESDDLIHWTKERSYTIGIKQAGCVWAPEAVYDWDKKAFLVFFASMVKQESDLDPKQRIYASYTKDFRNFGDVFLYMERDRHVIDSTILEDKGSYYRITKDETNSKLTMEQSDSLLGEFHKIETPLFEKLEGVEGPEGYLLPDGKTWCVIADQFAAHKGYLPMVTTDLSSGEFTILEKNTYDMGQTRKRHGGVLIITDEEYENLLYFFDRSNPIIDQNYADPDLQYLNDKFYIYPTTDGFENWSSHTFDVLSSQDGKQFKKEKTIIDVATDQVPWAVGSAWAPCLTEKDGKYFYYFCARNDKDVSCIGAAYAESPEGPFTVVKDPIVTIEMVRECGISNMSQTIDPSIYQENGTYYLVFGNCAAVIVELSEDMLQIQKETMHEVAGLKDFRESLIIVKRENKYHYTWSCDDTRSEEYHVNYGISDALFGKVEFQYPILQKDTGKGILATGHHSILKMPREDRYLIAYHRFGTPLSKYPKGKGWNRELCIAPLEFDNMGLIRPVITV